MMSYSNFERIYDRYCPMLYGMAILICQSKKKAEELLLNIFRKIQQENINQEKYPAYCITLIQLLIVSARLLYPEKFISCFRLKQFEKTPLLNSLICDQINLQDYCKENFLTQEEALKIIRKEFNTIRNSGKEDRISNENFIPLEGVLA